MAVVNGSDVIETVVVTGTKFNPDSAPAKSSLKTTQPETIINNAYIEDYLGPTADYVDILSIAPSMTGMDLNGPGLSESVVKNTMRGMSDGMFVMTYDGVPFGDTNGPSHHSSSYFPSSTIGSIKVDRGPGEAGDLGSATFGGAIHLYSEKLRSDPRASAKISAGSWSTTNIDANGQTGDMNFAGTTRVLFNFQDTQSSGAMTQANMMRDNELLKIENAFAPGWMLTIFANRSAMHQHENDNFGATPAQVVNYGKHFQMQDDDPSLPTFYRYNYDNKLTDMEYIKLEGEIIPGVSVSDQAYTYAYINKTVTTTETQQTEEDIENGTWGDGKTMKGKGQPGTTVDGVDYESDIPGYTKLNAYRVWGNIIKAAYDFDISGITGQVRGGFWWEGQATQRTRHYIDITQCFENNCDPFKDSKEYADQNAKKGDTFGDRDGVGYDEHTGWNQWQTFLDIEIHPTERLTFTPGVKYVEWRASVQPGSVIKGPYEYAGPTHYTTTRTLPFANLNYRLAENWSVYAQYAQGIYIPDISYTFENKDTAKGDETGLPNPETTNNYQIGTVYYGDNFSVDADLYYLGVSNNLAEVSCSVYGGSSGDDCYYNSGSATYKGAEAEGSYAFGGAFRGLSFFGNGSYNFAKTDGLDIKESPHWTAAAGLIYKRHGFKVSLVDKITGAQYMDNNEDSFYRVGAYNKLNFKLGYDIGHYGIAFSVHNLLNSRKIVHIEEQDDDPTGSSARDYKDRLDSMDQYYFQPARSFMLTLKGQF